MIVGHPHGLRRRVNGVWLFGHAERFDECDNEYGPGVGCLGWNVFGPLLLWTGHGAGVAGQQAREQAAFGQFCSGEEGIQLGGLDEPQGRDAGVVEQYR